MIINERLMRPFRHACCVSVAVLLVPSALLAQQCRHLTVGELFSLVESGSRSLRLRQTDAEAAARGVEVAKTRRLPDVNASLSVSYVGNVLMSDRDFSNVAGFSQPHFGNSFALEASQTVYAGGAVNAGIRLAELQKQQADAGVELTRAGQRFEALGLYLDLFKADNAKRVYERNIALTERLMADIRARQSQGMALRNDVTRYELQMETLRLGLRKVCDRRAVLNHRLCNMLGVDAGARIEPDTTVAVMACDGSTETEWQMRAAASSPVLRRAELEVGAAGQQLRQARSVMLPEVAVVAADNMSGPFAYDIPPIDKNVNIWYVGLGVRYSLSSLFKGNKAVRRAKVAVARSGESHAVTAETLDNSVQEAYTLYRQAFAELATQRKNVQLASENYVVMNDRYVSRLALVTDMIDASDIRLDAELREVDARINIVYAYYKMKYLAGEI